MEDRGHFVIRSFVLTDVESGDKRKVKQYHYLNWPDFDVPRNPKQFLEFVAAVRESGCFLAGSGPPVGKSTHPSPYYIAIKETQSMIPANKNIFSFSVFRNICCVVVCNNNGKSDSLKEICDSKN